MYLKIDSKKILESKTPKVDALTESLNFVKANQTPTNIINFMSSYKKCSKDVIIENLSSLCDINSDITFSYFYNVLEVAELSNTKLDEYKSHISSLLESSNDSDYSDKLTDSITVIDSIIENNNDMNLIREEMLLNLSVDRIKRSCVFESYLEDDLEVLIYNINSSPETISEYEQLIRKIKVSKTSEYFSSYPTLLVKNTDMIRNLNIRVTGDVLDLVTSMPTVIANKLCETNISATVAKSYIKIFDKQIALMYTELKHNDSSKYQLYSTYVRKLIEAKRKITDKYNINDVKESYISENITEMQPDIVLYDEGVLEDVIAEMEDSLVNIIFDAGDEINEPELENFTRLYRTYEATNRVQKGMIKAGHKAGSGTQKVVNKMKSAQTDAKRATLPIKKSLEPIGNMLNNTINKLKDMDKKERTERIITGEFRLKLVNYIKSGIIGLASIGAGVAGAKVVGKLAAGVLLSPSKLAGLIIVAIGILVGVGINKKIDAKHRQRILNDLESELAIVNEKIDDAKSANDNKSKYELMRIQQRLKKDIERIKFNLD